MREEISDEAIAVFLEGLEKRDRSDALRAYRAWFIRAHALRIERYIEGRLAEKGLTHDNQRWARRTRTLLDRHATGPRHCAFNPHTGAVEPLPPIPARSFRLATRPRESLTFHNAGHPAARIAGYALAFLAMAFVLWCGWKLAASVIEHAEGWARMIEHAAD